jgi:hypothetical protein
MSDDDGDLRLAELLDHSFGIGPDRLPAPVDRLAAGRRALRRRHRFGVAASAAAVVAAVGVVVAVSGGSGQQAAPPQPTVATAPGSPSAHVSPTDVPEAGPTDLTKALERLSRRAHRAQDLVDAMSPLVTVDGDGALRAGPGAALVATRPAPVVDGVTDRGDQLAEVRRGGRTWFVVVRHRHRDGRTMAFAARVLPNPTLAGLADYLAEHADSLSGLK